MKKKLLSALLVAAMTFTMVGCGASKPAADAGSSDNASTEAAGSTETSSEGYELALITDVGTIDDKSFNQGSWEGLVKYADENGITSKYYKPAEQSDEAFNTSIDLAVKGGAKVIVTPGFLFQVPVLEAQEKYPDVTFIIIDAAPQDADGNITIADNTLSIFYSEQQAGYLAGYAAVTEGYTQLGFMGGIPLPAVVRYGYGFIEGADAAAADMGLAAGDVNIKYFYTGDFAATPENQTKASSWYTDGTEVIFGCGGAVGNSVMKAAEAVDGAKVIGVDVDQSSESSTVITSAMKNLGTSVYNAIASYYDGTFEGGKSVTLGADSEGIELPMDTSVFTVFDQAKYDELFGKLADGTIKVDDDTVAEDATGVPATLVTVEVE